MLKSLRLQVDTMGLPELIELVLKRTQYQSFIDDKSLQAADRLENVKELISVAREYSDYGLTGFLEEVALISDLDSVDEKTDAVTLMTLHAAKGLEFPVVFMVGMEESIFPHSRALFDASEMEEERRLCYVGMTRAREELYMISASSRLLYGLSQYNPPSRFLSDIAPEATQLAPSPFETSFAPTSFPSAQQSDEPYVVSDEAADLSIGDRVRHTVFGGGQIVSIDGTTVAVNFNGKGIKKLNVAFAPLERLE